MLSIERYEEALKNIDSAIKHDKKNIMAYYNKSVILQSLNKHEEAIKSIAKGLKIDSNNSLLWFKKGNILFQREKFKKAIECFDKVLRDPNFMNYEQTRRNKLLALHKLGQL